MASPTSSRPAHHGEDGKFFNPWPSYAHGHALDYIFKVYVCVQWCAPSSLSGASRSTPPIAVQLAELAKADVDALPNGPPRLHGRHTSGSATSSDVDWACNVSAPGPRRYTPTPCAVDDLPPIHGVIISHNHYDHLDGPTIQQLLKKDAREREKAAEPAPPLRWFCGLRVSETLTAFGVPRENIVELDWWQRVPVAAPGPTHGDLTVIAVPAQHHSQRSMFDRYTSLWCGFVLQVSAPGTAAHPSPCSDAGHLDGSSGGAGAVAESPAPASRPLTVFFAGDTGYRTVGADVAAGSPEEKAAPTCPAFKQVGEELGPIDLGLIPIGAYSPRWFMCGHHTSPEDAVDLHMDIRAIKSIGMHWGTFPMTDEPIDEPPRRLAAALAARGLPGDAFVTIQHGATWAATTLGSVPATGRP